MGSSTINSIKSLPLEGRHPLYYYSDFDLLTLDGGFLSRLKVEGDFSDILFRYFLGIRKLTALKQSQQDPVTVFLEPWRTCNLACTYCYAESDPSYKKKIDKSLLTKLLKKYPFKRISVFGGEPLLDAQLLLELQRTHKWEEFFFSTNGVLLDREASKELLSMPNVRFQISLEPPEWSRRVTVNGEKQIDFLSNQLRSHRDSNLNLRVTIPPDVPYVPLKGFIDNLALVIGSWQFSISYWPARAPKPVDWLNRWIQESYELVQGDSEGKYRGKLPGCHMLGYFRDRSSEGFRFFNCNAGYGSVSIGPDNKLHGCHELAVVESESDDVSSKDNAQEIDGTKRLKLVEKWSEVMNYQTCKNCTSRYVCGGVCFVLDLPNSACHFVTELLPLALSEMIRYDSTEILNLASRSEEKFKKLFSKKEGLAKEVKSAKWKRLVSGELPLEEAVGLANRLLSD